VLDLSPRGSGLEMARASKSCALLGYRVTSPREESLFDQRMDAKRDSIDVSAR
jgi:hypothetical protein